MAGLSKYDINQYAYHTGQYQQFRRHSVGQQFRRPNHGTLIRLTLFRNFAIVARKLTIHQVKRYCAKQRYRADLSRFFWRYNISPGLFGKYNPVIYVTKKRTHGTCPLFFFVYIFIYFMYLMK